MVERAAGIPDARGYLDLGALDELRGIRVEDGALVLGAATTYDELRRSPLVGAHVPVLAEMARQVGAVQIQNRGTLGGNIATASPAGDSLPVLLALDAEIVVGSTRGERTIAAAAFFPAYRRTALAADELILRIRVPIRPDRVVVFRKVGTRQAQSISVVVLAVAWRPEDGAWHDVRVALGSVAADADPGPGDGGGPRGRATVGGGGSGRRRDARGRDRADRRRPLHRGVPPRGGGPRPPPHRARRRRLVAGGRPACPARRIAGPCLPVAARCHRERQEAALERRRRRADSAPLSVSAGGATREPPAAAVGMCGSEPVTPASTVAITAAGWSDRRSPFRGPGGCRLDERERLPVQDRPEAGRRVLDPAVHRDIRWVLPSIRASITPSPRSM